MPRTLLARRRALRTLPLAVLVACCAAAPAPAAPDVAPAEFPAAVEESGIRLARNGIGLCEWGIFEIDLYRAALWLEVPCSDAPRILAAGGAKRIDLVFLRELSEEQMRKAYRAAFDANATDDEAERFRGEIADFVAAIGAVGKGERLSIVHAPGAGVELRHGGESSRHGDDTFAELVFRLYLGEAPPTRQLRRGLLGEHECPEELRASVPDDGTAPDTHGERDDESPVDARSGSGETGPRPVPGAR